MRGDAEKRPSLFHRLDVQYLSPPAQGREAGKNGTAINREAEG